MFPHLFATSGTTKHRQRHVPRTPPLAPLPTVTPPPAYSSAPRWNRLLVTLSLAALLLPSCSQRKFPHPAHTPDVGATALRGSYSQSPAIRYRNTPPSAAIPVHPHDAFELDLYHAKGISPQQVVVFIHGGGWMGGDKSNIQKSPGLIDFFVRRGYMVASVNFRLPQRHDPLAASYKDQADDIAAAIGWLSQNVQNYGGSPDEFILLGYSSGAHLAALVTTDGRFLARHGLDVSRIGGTILLDAHCYDIPSSIAAMRDSPDVGSIPLITYLFGHTLEDMVEASPASYVASPGTVPFLIVSAGVKDGHDQLLSKDNSESFRKKLANHGHSASHKHFRSKSHTDLVTEFGIGRDPVSSSVDKFLSDI